MTRVPRPAPTARRAARRARRHGPRHRQCQVEAIEQRARQLLAVALDTLGRARARRRRIAAGAARAEVHRRDQLEARRETTHGHHPGDDHHAVLERLAQRLEHRPGELGQLVEEEHAVVREAGLAGPRRVAPPPTIAAAEAEWCGARNGGTRISPAPARARRRPSGSASPRAPRRRRAAAGSPAGAGRASSCRFPAARRSSTL